MESFYGGKPGFSCLIVKSFSSVKEMVDKFKLGGDYSDVHYNESVLINTVNKNDPENGNLYRRGYDYTNSLGGAIYIGSIVGPSGPAPKLEMTTIAGVESKKNEVNSRFTSGEYAPTANLVPGKVSDTEFNDSIKWACCSVRDKDNKDCTAYIGFRFPYLIEEFISGSVDPYYHRSNTTATFENNNLVDRQDDGRHPFYQKWKINVPKGIKGDTFKNFKMVTASSNIQDYPGRADDIQNGRKVLVYEYYHYDKDRDGEPVTMYLGDYNMISGITITDEGTITIDYTHDNDTVYTKLFKWIKSVTLNKDTGHFKVEYNHATDKSGQSTVYETDLSWVKDIQIATNGDVTLSYSTGDTKKLPTGLRWINEITMAANGTVTVLYNDGTSNVFDKKIQWVTNVSLTDEGVFTIKYNNGTPDYTTKLIWVKDVTLDADGTLKIVYNGKEATVYSKRIKYIDDVYVDEDKKIHITYNTGTEEAIGEPLKIIDDIYIDKTSQLLYIVYNTGEVEAVGEPLNYIVEVDITDDYHLLAYYSDPALRAEIVKGNRNYKKGWKEKDDWLDLGSIKEENGILVGLNLDIDKEEYASLIDSDAAIAYLNETYPEGLTSFNLKGKVVTIGSVHEIKKFYAFDYSVGTNTTSNYEGWFYLGTFNDNLNMIERATDAHIEEKKSRLAILGIWFIVED